VLIISSIQCVGDSIVGWARWQEQFLIIGGRWLEHHVKEIDPPVSGSYPKPGGGEQAGTANTGTS